jgi:anaerobic magnesium-protoporphyrin IX monomethyl ester cyclase
MDRILFIIPPYVGFNHFVNPAYNERVVEKQSGTFGSVVTDMPIGILSLSSYLKAHTDVEVKLIDFNIILNKIESFKYDSFSELFHDVLSESRWIEFSPSIIGISALFTPSYANMKNIAQVARDLYPDALVIAGGGVPTNMYNEIFKETKCLDALCYGEGEMPLLKLVKAIDKRELLRSHPSWITKEKVEKGHSYRFEFISNLDEIPFYDYGIINTVDYSLSPTISTIVAFKNSKNNRSLFHVATSRGCPHHCCYCASYTVHGRRMRYHSFERVRDDLKRLKDQYGAELIGIQDDNFMADKDRALKIINTAKDMDMRLFFQSGLPLYALDRTMLEAIKNAGLNELVLPIESGSNRVLREIMHKPLDLSIVKRVIADCRELGIDTDANILIGLPGETKQDIEDTRQFLKTLDATWFRIYVATPLVGSEMFDICMQKKYLRDNYIDCDFKRAVVETEHFTAEYIQEKAYSLNLELNFVGNSDIRLGNYGAALKGFENTIRITNDHAFAFYFAAKCCKMMNQNVKYPVYKAKYEEIVKSSEFWRNYSVQFNLGAL